MTWISMRTETCMQLILTIIAFKDIQQVSTWKFLTSCGLLYFLYFCYSIGSYTAATVAGFSLGSGTSRSELYYPTAISVKPNGTMFILDRSNSRVLRWQMGDTLGYVIAGGNGNGGAFTQIGTCYGIYADDSYNVYISELTNHRVTKWTNGNTTSGTLVSFVFFS